MKKMFIGLFLAAVVALSASAEIITVGAIEIGSRGIKCVAFDIDHKDNGDFEVSKKVFSDSNNVAVMSDLKDGSISFNNIANATSAVLGYQKKLESLKVSKMVIAASSGVAMAKNKDELKDSIEKSTASDMMFISSEEEGFYTLISSVGLSKLTTSVLLDVGSGNGRFSYLQGKDISSIRTVTIPYGSLTLKDQASKAGGNYANAVQSIIDTEVVPMVSASKSKNPGLTNPFRKIVIVGGSAWAMSALISPSQIGKNSIKYTYGDMSKFVKNLKSSGEIQYPANPSPVAVSVLSKVADTMSGEDLIAGGTLIQSSLNAIGLRDNREVTFPSESGWTAGYLIYNLSK